MWGEFSTCPNSDRTLPAERRYTRRLDADIFGERRRLACGDGALAIATSD